MNEVIINSARTCAFTGHRIIKNDFDKADLKFKIESLIKIGYDTFLVGMAIGFDTVVFNVLEKIRENNDIRIISCIPCVTQSYKFNNAQKKEYDRMTESADEVIFVSQEYTSRCMQKRNEFMVDNSSCIISYIRRDFGGSVNTVKYAVKKGITVISV